MAIKVYIDQGHNPVNPNAGSEGNGYREQDLVYEIGVRLSDVLHANGYETRLSRPSPTTQLGTSVASSLAARVNDANAWGANYFVSLHTNASVNPDANGAEIFVYRLGSVAADLAESVLEQLVLSTGVRARSILARPGLYVLRRTQMPAILVEMGFITNPHDANLLANSPQLFANGIADGIIDYVNRSVLSSVELTMNDEVQEEPEEDYQAKTTQVFGGLQNDSNKINQSYEVAMPVDPQREGGTARDEGRNTEENENAENPQTYEEFLLENNHEGKLKVQAFLGNQALPVEGVRVRIIKDIGPISYIFYDGFTNEDGIIDNIVLPAPPMETSLKWGLPDTTVIYRLEAEKEGYIPMAREIEMFDGIKTIQPLRLIAENGGNNGNSENS